MSRNRGIGYNTEVSRQAADELDMAEVDRQRRLIIEFLKKRDEGATISRSRRSCFHPQTTRI